MLLLSRHGHRYRPAVALATDGPSDDSRVELAAAVRRGHAGLWPEAREPSPTYSPSDVIALTLIALRYNDSPVTDAGAATLRRFSTPGFRLAGMPADPPPQQLSALLREPCQYSVLVQPDGYELSLPSDTVYSDDANGCECAFQEVQLDEVGGGDMMVKIGWELQRMRGCWLTSSIAWQDFRDGAPAMPECTPGKLVDISRGHLLRLSRRRISSGHRP
tara:strand:- start:574 stop:1227 length:654 start_codon:yes stop_codon:yes gene_type:complete